MSVVIPDLLLPCLSISASLPRRQDRKYSGGPDLKSNFFRATVPLSLVLSNSGPKAGFFCLSSSQKMKRLNEGDKGERVSIFPRLSL